MNLQDIVVAATVTRITPSGAVTENFAELPRGAGVSGLAADPYGNIYSSNYSGHSLSRISPTGVVSTYALAPTASPTAIASDSAGTIYSVDAQGMTVARLTAAGAFTPDFAVLDRDSVPYGIVADTDGTLYTANSGDDTISEIRPTGAVVKRFASVKPVFGSAAPVAIIIGWLRTRQATSS